MSLNKELIRRDDKVASVIQRIIKTFGLCDESQWATFRLAQLARACFVILIITQTITLFMSRGDTEKLFECFSVLTFCIMGALKDKSLRSKYKEWSYLLTQLDNLEFNQLNNERSDVNYESDGEDTDNNFKAHINRYTEKFHSLSVKVFRVYYFTCTLFVLTPFIEYLYWKFVSGEIMSYPHVLPGWSPLESFGWWWYSITMMAEICAAFYTVTVHTVFDLTVFGLMIFLSGQFLLLRDFTESIAGTGRGYDVTIKRNLRAHYRIIRCHRTLKTLDNSVIRLDKLVHKILGIYFLVAILTLCSVAMRLSSEEMSVMKVVSLVQYTGGCLIQLFLFCYYGDMVLHRVGIIIVKEEMSVMKVVSLVQYTGGYLIPLFLFCCYYGDIVLHRSSIGMGEGAYASAWWRLSPRMRREALLLAAWQARSRRLRAGPFNRLDLPSFIQIVRAAYSYYAVLRK